MLYYALLAIYNGKNQYPNIACLTNKNNAPRVKNTDPATQIHNTKVKFAPYCGPIQYIIVPKKKFQAPSPAESSTPNWVNLSLLLKQFFGLKPMKDPLGSIASSQVEPILQDFQSCEIPIKKDPKIKPRIPTNGDQLQIFGQNPAEPITQSKEPIKDMDIFILSSVGFVKVKNQRVSTVKNPKEPITQRIDEVTGAVYELVSNNTKVPKMKQTPPVKKLTECIIFQIHESGLRNEELQVYLGGSIQLNF